LGGALAIGIGFGSQNIVNNFISGLILLVERPIKEGDIVEIDSSTGTVEHIGPRSTRIKTPSNTHIVVPNSAFLEKNVVNWTLADDLIRAKIELGVAYGSPTREVESILLEVVKTHPKTLDSPEPIVLFRDFGDNALVFEVDFWLRMPTIRDRRIVESDIRHTIAETLQNRGISIPFPQRDLHLDTLKPLDIRLLDGTAAAQPAARTSTAATA
jgi:small-conductance mechanosensitive channel